MSFLAIDFGLRKIGLALSDGELARPLPVLKIKDPFDAQRKILALIELHQVETIVFGVPQPDSIGAEKFAQSLEKTSGVTIMRVDESMTTKLSKEKLTSKKVAEDSVAAALLLQEYLDNRKGDSLAI